MKSEEGDERFQNMARAIQSGYGVVKKVLDADRQDKKSIRVFHDRSMRL